MPINHSEDEAHLIPNSAEHGIEPSEQFDTSINDVAAEGIHRRNCHRLYLSHALSTWNSRVFEFGAFLFLASIFPDTLLPASIYALARSAAAAIGSPWLGGYIDRSDRLGVVRLSIFGQRIPVALSCGGFLLLLYRPHLKDSLPGQAISLLLLSLLACIEKLSAVTNTISVERDWVVEVAQGNEQRLSRLNSQMRRIDLFCKLVGPLAISVADTYSTSLAVALTGLMSTCSVVMEYVAIARVYRSVGALQAPKEAAAVSIGRERKNPVPHLTDALATLSRYIRHAAFLPSVSLALLYLTVLSFSGQLITYLIAIGMSSATIALLRAVAAVFELTATWIGPLLNTRIGAVRSGIWFLNIELLFIAGACTCLWLPSTDSSRLPLVIGLVSCVIVSRTGLWGFDLSAQLIIQDEVEPELRGTFSALECSLQNVFEMLAFASTAVFARPDQFKYPATISAVAVAAASALYACFVRQRRGHLIHSSTCMEGRHSWKRRRAGWAHVDDEEEGGSATEMSDR